MWIDITKFMLIKTAQFDEIIAYYGVTLTSSDELYLITYLFANFLAYFLIILVCYMAFTFAHRLMPLNYKRRYFND